MDSFGSDCCTSIISHGDDRSNDELESNLLNLELHRVNIGEVF